jgi:hypothetical protein
LDRIGGVRRADEFDKKFDAGEEVTSDLDLSVVRRPLFPTDLERRAFRASNGEFGWSRKDVRSAIVILADDNLAILGGELWWVPEGASGWTGLIPQRDGSIAVYSWSTEQRLGEEWTAFVGRCAALSVDSVDSLPGDADLPTDLGGRILYNLTWATEDWYLELQATRVRPQSSSWMRRLLGRGAGARR